MLQFFAWSLVFISLILGGGGFINYQRNAHLDDELALARRPYARLSENDLGRIEKAYRDEIASFQGKAQRYAEAMTNEGKYHVDTPDDLHASSEHFGTVTGDAGRLRALQAEATDREVEIEAIERERWIRSAHLDDPWVRFRRRLLTF